MIPPIITQPIVRMVFRLDEFANKGLAEVIRATQLAARQIPDLRLEIIGDGSPQARAKAARLGKGQRHVTFLGAVANTQIQQTLNGSVCLVMPSRRESYGMVFAEALRAGCPIIHGRGNGIQGYFPSARFAQRAGRSTADLAGQIVGMIRNQNAIKSELRAAQTLGVLDRLARPAIAAAYGEALRAATGLTALSHQPPGMARAS